MIDIVNINMQTQLNLSKRGIGAVKGVCLTDFVSN